MSGTAARTVLALKRVTSAEKFVLVAIALRLGKKQCAWPNQATLAVETCLSKSTIIRVLKDLERDGYIERSRRNRPDGSRSSDIYSLPCIGEGFVECSIRTFNQGVTTKPRLKVIDGGAQAKSKVSS